MSVNDSITKYKGWTQEEKDAECKKLCPSHVQLDKDSPMHNLDCPYNIDRWKSGKTNTGGKLW